MYRTPPGTPASSSNLSLRSSQGTPGSSTSVSSVKSSTSLSECSTGLIDSPSRLERYHRRRHHQLHTLFEVITRVAALYGLFCLLSNHNPALSRAAASTQHFFREDIILPMLGEHSTAPRMFDKMIDRSNTASLKIMFRFLKKHKPRGQHGELITNHTEEQERCKRYGFNYAPAMISNRRRRIFFGGPIADDSWHALGVHAAEAYGLYHTAVFVDSNTTHTMTPRNTRFSEGSLNSEMLTKSGMFGPTTNVTVDYYVDEPVKWRLDEHLRENLQRDQILQTWQANGMTRDDIGLIADVDETFTRDFLLAAMTCDVPEFRRGQDCRMPKVVSFTLIIESSPSCITESKGGFHPDMVLGECIENIGNSTDREIAVREHREGTTGRRVPGGGKFLKDWVGKRITRYPLWRPVDFRSTEGGKQYREVDPNTGKPHLGFGHTAYHFHNFFDNFTDLRNKYKTYGHPQRDVERKPLGELQEDINVAVLCAMNRSAAHVRRKPVRGGWEEFVDQAQGRRIPLLYANKQYRMERHEELKQQIKEDEAVYGIY